MINYSKLKNNFKDEDKHHLIYIYSGYKKISENHKIILKTLE